MPTVPVDGQLIDTASGVALMEIVADTLAVLALASVAVTLTVFDPFEL